MSSPPVYWYCRRASVGCISSQSGLSITRFPFLDVRRGTVQFVYRVAECVAPLYAGYRQRQVLLYPLLVVAAVRGGYFVVRAHTVILVEI